MAKWSINGDASIDSNGVATFPKNTGTTDIEYTITYEDDNGCTGSTTYTVPYGQDCRPTCTYGLSASSNECKKATITTVNYNVTCRKTFSYTFQSKDSSFSQSGTVTVPPGHGISDWDVETLSLGHEGENYTFSWADSEDSSNTGSNDLYVSSCGGGTKLNNVITFNVGNVIPGVEYPSVDYSISSTYPVKSSIDIAFAIRVANCDSEVLHAILNVGDSSSTGNYLFKGSCASQTPYVTTTIHENYSTKPTSDDYFYYSYNY